MTGEKDGRNPKAKGQNYSVHKPIISPLPIPAQDFSQATNSEFSAVAPVWICRVKKFYLEKKTQVSPKILQIVPTRSNASLAWGSASILCADFTESLTGDKSC